MKKILALVIVLVTAFSGLMFPVQVHAADIYESYLIPLKVEYWHDAAARTFWMDLMINGHSQRINLGNEPFGTYEPEFPTALITDITNQYKYTVSSIEITSDENGDFIYNGSVEEPKSRIFGFPIPGAALTNTGGIIGQSGTTVSFKARFQVPGVDSCYKYKAPNGVQMFKTFIPIKVTFKKTLANPKLTVSGFVSPNPATLSNGVATHSLDITSSVVGIEGDTPKDWKLEYRKDGTIIWIPYDTSSSNDSVSKGYSGLEITEDTIYYLRSTLTTTGGQVLTVTGQVTELVNAPTVGWFNIVFDPYADPDTFEMTKSDVDRHIKISTTLTLDATDSTAELGIDSYLYYYKLPGGEWIYSPETTGTWSPTVELDPATATNGKIQIDCRVWVKDNTGARKSASEDVPITINVNVQPPITAIDPMEPYIEGIAKDVPWSYQSDDGILFRDTKYSVSKINGDDTLAPMVTDAISGTRAYTLTGQEYTFYRISENVYDMDGRESNIDTRDIFVDSNRPVIRVDFNDADLESGILHAIVTDVTPYEISKDHPTQYTTWILYNHKGEILANGTGIGTQDIALTDVHYGTVLVLEQKATNDLGKTAVASNFYALNSRIGFAINPEVLYETEYATLTDSSRKISEKAWKVKLAADPDTAFGDLVLPLDMKTTQSKGVYNVRLDGYGMFSEPVTTMQYSNNLYELTDNTRPAALTDAAVKSAYGASAEYCFLTACYNSPLYRGAFENGGTAYKFAREVKHTIIKNEILSDSHNVEFKNASPVCNYTVIGDKQYRKITIDLSSSIVATDVQLQIDHPIDWNADQTYLSVAYLTDGAVDITKNQYIKGLGRNEFLNDVRFGLANKHNIRFDKPGLVRFSGIVYNGLKSSPAKVFEKVIRIDEPINVQILPDSDNLFRLPDSELKVYDHLTVNFDQRDEDPIDLTKSRLLIRYDANNNGNFLDDGDNSTMYVGRDTEDTELNTIRTNKVFNQQNAVISLLNDAVAKNILGKFELSFEAIDSPSEPYFHIVGQTDPVVMNDPAESIKIVTIDNNRPSISFETLGSRTARLVIIDTPGCQPIDIQAVLDAMKIRGMRLDIVHISVTGVKTNYKNY